MMINYQELQSDLIKTPVESFGDQLIKATQHKFDQYTHGELDQWQALLAGLPTLKTSHLNLTDKVAVGLTSELEKQLSESQILEFGQQLKTLHPWRKGPFELFGIHIDTEWRSDWKWDRLLPHIAPLKHRSVLDVGCGNGYHCWRMAGEGAKLVLGIDPSQKFLAQFSVFKKYLDEFPVHLLPLGIEDMPSIEGVAGFDTVFSMGVLYHRKSPIEHLLALKDLMLPGAELVLETLVIDGDKDQCLVPQGRYAQMRNVWFLPSASALELWLTKCGFKNVRTVDINQTTTQEQRTTEWMHFHSLSDYLDPKDKNLTIEGYPAPRRAIVIANK